MARIRTIKPEFPQSESIGNLSREARLCFIMLWTIADDDGRLRAASRMLASLLYPYDDDAKNFIDGWLAELERENCIIRYSVGGSKYAVIVHWLDHQKIDHPTKSRLPPPPGTPTPEAGTPPQEGGSRNFAKPRERSRRLAPDLGPWTMDQEESRAGAPPTAPDESGKPKTGPTTLLTEEAKKFAAMYELAVKADLDSPDWYGVPYSAQVWLDRGWDQVEILKIGSRLARRHPGKGINFHDAVIKREMEERTSNPKAQRNGQATKHSLSGWQQHRDDARDARAEFKQHVKTDVLREGSG